MILDSSLLREWFPLKIKKRLSRQQIPIGYAVWLRKLKQGLCINLEGWDGEGDGMEDQKVGDICMPMADSY